jgi:hypothetical protein
MEELLAGEHAEAPSQAAGMEIVTRMVAVDPIATSEFAAAYYVPVLHALRRRHPDEDEGSIVTAVSDAVWAFIRRPEQYDPGRLLIMSYLRMAAERDLLNVRKQAVREWTHQAGWGSRDGDVELSRDLENYRGDELDDPARIVELGETVHELAQQLGDRVAIVRHGLKPEEIEAIPLVFDGERRTEVYSRLLGWEHLAKNIQRNRVKRFKDKVHKRLHRAGVAGV